VFDGTSNKKLPVNLLNTKSTTAKITGKDTYTVRAGDTMYSIAWRAGLDVNTLIKRNHLKKPYIIHTGQVLQLTVKNKKTRDTSQNSKKEKIIPCSVQSCKEKGQLNVVIKSQKAYSAKKSAEKIVKAKQVETKKKPDSTKISQWVWPSKGQLVKTFTNSAQGMKGISIANQRGTPVYAAAAGKVVYSGSGLRGYGKLIIIRHNYDYLSAYAHNETLMIKENQQVKAGQQIATMGNSGTDAVRLHFDIRYRGKSVDPLRYLPKRY